MKLDRENIRTFYYYHIYAVIYLMFMEHEDGASRQNQQASQVHHLLINQNHSMVVRVQSAG